MSTPITFNGSGYTIPAVGDSQWGQSLSNYFIAISTGALQKTGGAFTLTAEVDFGATYGLKSAYFKSRTANSASSGALRLANADVINWRNIGNTGNLPLGINSDTMLTLNNIPPGVRVFNVRTYGALGDSSHDDTAAIQDCFDAASSADSAGAVYFPGSRNQYKITDSILIGGANSVLVFGDGPQCSGIRFYGSNTVPAFILSDANTAGIEIHNLSFGNSGSATIAIQVNCTKVFIHNCYFLTTTKFSEAYISTYQVADYNYYTVVRECYFSAYVSGEETPIFIRFGGGHTNIVDACMLSGFSVAGVKFELDGLGGSVLGSSVTNSHFESFAGDDPNYPGSHNAVGIYADGILGLNVSSTNFQMNSNAEVAATAQRSIALYAVKGANLQGNLHFNTGSGAAISIRSANAQGINIDGNTFYDMDSAVEVTAANSSYWVGPGNEFSNVTTNIDDSYAPRATTGSLRFPNGVDAISWRNAADSENCSLAVDSSDRLVFGGSFYFRKDQNTNTRGFVVNANSGASATAKFSLSTDVDDFDLAAFSSGAGSGVEITAHSGFTGGLQIASVGGTLKLVTASSNRLTLDLAGNVVIGPAVIATNATDGFLYLPTCAGTPTGVPTAYSGRAAHVYDTSNNKLYVYNGGWKSVTLS